MMDKEEQLQHFFDQYADYIKMKDGIYYYPDNIPEILKEYLETQNKMTKDFPNWSSNKKQEVTRISEEETLKEIEKLKKMPIVTDFD